MRSNTGRPSAVIVFRTFWPTLISVICLEKLRDLSLGPMTPFQRPICVSIRLRWLYPVACAFYLFIRADPNLIGLRSAGTMPA